MNTITVLSGTGQKGPACMLLQTEGRRWLLDCGYGPEASAVFQPDWLEGVEAVFVTHNHTDHIGGIDHVMAAGVPIYMTQGTAMGVPLTADVRFLPLTGETVIEGVRLLTGRSGHAIGGVWFHFDLGDGFFYSGDWSEDSHWFAFDVPPPAATAVLDCSYQQADVAQDVRRAELEQLIDSLSGLVLFPVPSTGRAGELALHLMRRYGPDAVFLDAECRTDIRVALELPDGVLETAADIAPLLARDDPAGARFLVCGDKHASTGEAAAYVQTWQAEGRLGRDAHVVFTGHMSTSAKQIEQGPGGYFRRWNVHPSLSEQKRMLQRLQARRFAPVFCPDPQQYRGLAGIEADIFTTETVPL